MPTAAADTWLSSTYSDFDSFFCFFSFLGESSRSLLFLRLVLLFLCFLELLSELLSESESRFLWSVFSAATSGVVRSRAAAYSFVKNGYGSLT